MNYPAGRSPVLHSRVVQPVIAMAKDVESMIDLAIDALLSSNKELASSILQREPAVNASEMKIDAAIFAVLEKGDLSRHEIRQAVSMLKINKDLERMADLAANIGRKINEMCRSDGAPDYSDLQPMGHCRLPHFAQDPARPDPQRPGAGGQCCRGRRKR